jgi:hypothetical protein
LTCHNFGGAPPPPPPPPADHRSTVAVCRGCTHQLGWGGGKLLRITSVWGERCGHWPKLGEPSV